MNKAVSILIPAALFVVTIWGLVAGINAMVAQENNNRFHAMLLDCRYLGKLNEVDKVLVFDCTGELKLHKQITW